MGSGWSELVKTSGKEEKVGKHGHKGAWDSKAAQAFNLRPQEEKAGQLRVQDQSELGSENLSPKPKGAAG